MEMIRTRVRDHFVLAVAYEERILVAHDVHCPEHRPDVCHPREVQVDIGSVTSHEERRDAVRVAIRSGIARLGRIAVVERRGLCEVGTRPCVLPARDCAVRVVEVVGGRGVHMHRRGGDERINVRIRRAPLLLHQTIDALAIRFGQFACERDQLRDLLAAVSVVLATILTELAPLAVL